MDLIRHIDHLFFHFINSRLSHPILDALMVFITNQNNWIFPLFILLIWMFGSDGKRGKIAGVILILTIIIVDGTAAQIIKPWVGRIRPSHALINSINLLVKPGGLYSFVSNHAANTFAFAVVIHYFYGRKQLWVFALAGLVAVSRVYVGVHYPADIICGALFGYGTAWCILSLWVIVKMRELKRNRTWVWYCPEQKIS
jgi:undecaprenyl-diphosphatase